MIFPRAHARGLIEGRPSGWGLLARGSFRELTLAASLKVNEIQNGDKYEATFRELTLAASLKAALLSLATVPATILSASSRSRPH